jgi:hypothetical protein
MQGKYFKYFSKFATKPINYRNSLVLIWHSLEEVRLNIYSYLQRRACQAKSADQARQKRNTDVLKKTHSFEVL